MMTKFEFDSGNRVDSSQDAQGQPPVLETSEESADIPTYLVQATEEHGRLQRKATMSQAHQEQA